jgi:hypothetical protein
MLNNEFWTVGHTTADISNVRFAISFLSELRSLFTSCDEIQVVWFDEERDRQVRCPCLSLPPQEIARIYARGAISFEAQEDTFFSGIEWRRFTPSQHAAFVQNHGYRQNEVSLLTKAHCFSEPHLLQRYVGFCINIARTFDINYMYAFYPSNLKRFDTQLHLGVGLHQIHWLNILGRPYLEIIPRDRLLSAPVYLAKAVDVNHIVLQVTERIPAPVDREFERSCDAVRQHIGEEYFTTQVRPKRPELNSGVYSFWRGLWYFWRRRNDFATEAELAEKRPEFRWDNILVGKTERDVPTKR